MRAESKPDTQHLKQFLRAVGVVGLARQHDGVRAVGQERLDYPLLQVGQIVLAHAEAEPESTATERHLIDRRAVMNIDECLATYGTLAPDRPNHHHLSYLEGKWLTGKVRGHLVQRGWGAKLGYPALIPSDNGDEIEVHLFLSPDLPQHWARLDAFEGAEYRRTPIRVVTETGPVEAWIYLDAQP
ncbi:gamma-glutamylcyclotransferase family protein [Sphingomonas sp. 22176]|uniref:gamma-glutamylcyclotransferase family protein n=1 Tax=Sphingomonas sp. 22176 TaxID=3453884 RepID=UPI003F876BC1